MTSCIIIKHEDITSLAICKILRLIFYEEDFEIEIQNKETLHIYLWNVKKIVIWQTVLQFITSQLSVGYGFGSNIYEAFTAAEDSLQKTTKIIYPQA
ncbi:hypothetical protein [Virgibacillus sp. SK37]|uniref:hypothetical protein n=1 Tax=Virgibacillus sp. SK37 TaxID=403957 RepID=UPI0004D0F83E|nr:hypothetical protein [Virgibacillus sp. SK37]AIF45187.1 hypothetical protein X953_03995 [Virgibacillus sp. SK37]